MENTSIIVDEGKDGSNYSDEKENATIEENEGVNMASEYSSEQPVSESESEKLLTKNLTHQFSNTRLWNENPVLFKPMSHVYSADSSEYPQFVYNPSFVLESNGNIVGNPALSGPSLITQQAGLLNEMRRNFSNKVYYNAGIPHFSRTPSLEGNVLHNEFIFSRHSSNTSIPDVSANTYDVSSNYNTNNMMHNDSLMKLDQQSLLGVKRRGDDNYSNTKVIRQNTQQSTVPLYPQEDANTAIPTYVVSPNNQITLKPFDQPIVDQSDSNSTSNTDEIRKRRVIKANVEGRIYQSEIRKKDKRNPQKWTKEEDQLLQDAVKRYGEKNWKDIASCIPDRNHVQCLQRWKKVLKPGLKKGHWTEEEDELLRTWKDKCTNWAEVAEHISGRTPKQCRERWCNHIDPTIRKGHWTEEEDSIIMNLQKQWGNRWSCIAQQLPGRSENAVKIRWKTLNRNRKSDSTSSSYPLAPYDSYTKNSNSKQPTQMSSPTPAPVIPPQTIQQVPNVPVAQPVTNLQNVPNIPTAQPVSLQSVPSIPLYQTLTSIPSVTSTIPSIPPSQIGHFSPMTAQGNYLSSQTYMPANHLPSFTTQHNLQLPVSEDLPSYPPLVTGMSDAGITMSFQNILQSTYPASNIITNLTNASDLPTLG